MGDQPTKDCSHSFHCLLEFWINFQVAISTDYFSQEPHLLHMGFPDRCPPLTCRSGHFFTLALCLPQSQSRFTFPYPFSYNYCKFIYLAHIFLPTSPYLMHKNACKIQGYGYACISYLACCWWFRLRAPRPLFPTTPAMA